MNNNRQVPPGPTSVKRIFSSSLVSRYTAFRIRLAASDGLLWLAKPASSSRRKPSQCAAANRSSALAVSSHVSTKPDAPPPPQTDPPTIKLVDLPVLLS